MPPHSRRVHQRSTLRVYNTVERLLRGDFFHAVDLEQLTEDLQSCEQAWPLVGLGTSNWYKRNGEIIVEGSAGEPSFLWGDPASKPPGHIVRLGKETPSATQGLKTPMVGDDDAAPSFPFVTFAECNPADKATWMAPPNTPFHEWLQETMEDGNIGLAALRVHAPFAHVEYTTMCHIPLGGAELSAGYADADAFKTGSVESKEWSMSGIYAANPTIQNMVSIEGHALHLHGHSPAVNRGGHAKVATTGPEGCRVDVWRLHDLHMLIRNLDVAWLPVQDVE